MIENENKNLYTMENLNKNFNKYIQFIAKRTYCQIMGTTDFEKLLKASDDQINDLLNTTKASIRTVHGVLHATRVTSYIDMLHGFRKECLTLTGEQDDFSDIAINYLSEKLKLNPKDILTLTKIAAFFHDSAREDDSYDYWEEKSAMNCLLFMDYLDLEQDICEFFYMAIQYKFNAMNDKKNKEEFEKSCKLIFNEISDEELTYCSYVRELIGVADCLDVMRTRRDFDADLLDSFFRVKNHQSDREENSTNKENSNKLILGIRKFINNQADILEQPCEIRLKNIYLKDDISYKKYSIQKSKEFDLAENPYDLIMKEFIAHNDKYLNHLIEVGSGGLIMLSEQNCEQPEQCKHKVYLAAKFTP